MSYLVTLFIALVLLAAIGLYWLVWATLTGRVTWRTGADHGD